MRNAFDDMVEEHEKDSRVEAKPGPAAMNEGLLADAKKMAAKHSMDVSAMVAEIGKYFPKEHSSEGPEVMKSEEDSGYESSHKEGADEGEDKKARIALAVMVGKKKNEKMGY